MADRCYFKGPTPPEGWDWIEAQGGWYFTCDQTPDAGGIPLSLTTPLRHEPAFWIEGETLFAQRDRSGRYPFAWLKSENGTFVSSDVELLHRIQCSNQWNRPHIAQTLSLYDNSDSQDVFLETYRIRPGERGRFTADGLQNIQPHPHSISIDTLEDALERLEAALQNVCETIPEPCTILLSGGLDSTTLAAMLASQNKALSAITLVSRFESQNEEAIVQKLCGDLQIPYEAFPIDAFMPYAFPGPWTQFWRYGIGLYPDIVYTIPLLSHLKQRNVNHFVSGFAADQFFSLSPYRVFEAGLNNRDIHACQAALDAVSKKRILGAIMSRSRMWRRLRAKPSWNQLEFWLTLPIHTKAVPTLEGWWYERAVRGLRLLEKHLNIQIYTPYCDARFLDVIESVDPFTRIGYAFDKTMLRLIAQKYLSKDIAWRPKSGLFSEFWEEQMQQMSPESLARRLEPISDFINVEALSIKLLERELSNVVTEHSACYTLTNAICIADVLGRLRDGQ